MEYMMYPLIMMRSLLPSALGLVLASSVAEASGVNDPGCIPSAAHPYPVVLVHGRSGHVTDMSAISNALLGEGYCVFGEDYGLWRGQTGLDHLSVSGAQLERFVHHVLDLTGARQVDTVGYSEGTGVIQDFILGKSGAALVHRVVSFGGLQHPYAHVGAPGFEDNDLYLPNLLVTARKVDPNITAQAVITTALDVYAGVGGQLADIDRDVAESPFASDLFDPTYWRGLHGGLSEPDGVYIRIASTGHGVPTHDRGAGVCYTNIVSSGDPITGQSAGFQDPAYRVENFILAENADHGAIIANGTAIAKMRSALATPCGASPDDGSGDDDMPTGEDGEGGGGSDDMHAGCAAGGSGGSWLVVVALGGIVTRRRRN
jgi:MYXO-CTERM domain-containing protein